MGHQDIWGAWLRNAEAMQASHPDSVRFFCAIETDARGLAPFAPLTDRLTALGGEWWTYHLDDGRGSVTTANRQRHLTMGEYLASEYATSTGATHLLFCAADCEPPPDVLPKLLEVDHPIVGAECPTYCLSGASVAGYPFPVQEQLASAACILLERDVFKQLKWRADPDLDLTDDPALQRDAAVLLGLTVLVRKDCVARHYPVQVPPLEERGYDLRVAR
jgi:hypothetical protein